MSEDAESTGQAPRQVPLVLMLIAGLFLGPGAGHFLVRKWRRGALFAVAFLATAALVKVLPALYPTPITIAMMWVPPFLRFFALIDLVRIPPEERVAAPLATAAPLAGGVALGWFAVEYVMSERVTQPHVVPTANMQPTMIVGDYIVLSKLLGPAKRGDIVVVAEPGKPLEPLARRVIGVGGDHVEVGDGALELNGTVVPVCELGTFDSEGQSYRLLVEGIGSPHLIMLRSGARDDTVRSWDVPAGELFVMGDNRDNSHDSRGWSDGKGATVGEKSITGYATFFMRRGDAIKVQEVRRIELPKGAESLRDKVQPCLDQLGYKP